MNNILRTGKRSRVLATSLATFSLILCSCSSSENITADTKDIIGEWNIVKAEGVSTKNAATPATIHFDAEGKVNGCASVNRFFGNYEFDGKNLSLKNVGVTRMMGPNMEIEDAVIKAMNSTHSAQIKGNKANFLNEEGITVMTLKKAVN